MKNIIYACTNSVLLEGCDSFMHNSVKGIDIQAKITAEYELTNVVRDCLKAIRSNEANEDLKMCIVSWVQLIVSISHNSHFLAV